MVLGLCEFVRGSLIFFVIPVYVHSVLGFSTGAVGYAMAAHYVFDTGLRSPAGWLVDRFGQRRVCIGLLFVAGIGLWLVVHCQQLSLILLGCALLGVGMAAVWPAVISRVTEGLASDAYATAMGGIMMVWLLGAGLGAICMSWFFGSHIQSGFRLLLIIWAGAYFVSVRVMRGRPLVRHTKFATNLGVILREVNAVKFLFPGVFVQTFAIGLLLPVLVLYARNVLHLDGRMYSYLLIAGGVSAVILQVPVGRLIDRYAYRPFLVFGFILAAVALPAIAYLHTISLVFLLVSLFGASYAFILPAWNSVVAKCISANRRAVMFGVFMTVEGMGMAVGPVVGTLMWNELGVRAPFDIASIILFMMSVLYGTMRLEHLFTRSDAQSKSEQAVFSVGDDVE